MSLGASLFSRFLPIFSALLLTALQNQSSAFLPGASRTFLAPRRQSSALNGLFDGVKSAFTAEPPTISTERETPIDRWMGWSARPSADTDQVRTVDGETEEFVDSMDENNYVVVNCVRPMGIIFEENDGGSGGVYIFELNPTGAASNLSPPLQPGDQLVMAGKGSTFSSTFEESLSAIKSADGDEEGRVKMAFFRGPRTQLYGPTGASREWIDGFVKKQSESDGDN